MAEILTASLTQVGTIITQAVDIVTSSDLCMLFVSFGLVRSGLGTFGVAKNVAM